MTQLSKYCCLTQVCSIGLDSAWPVCSRPESDSHYLLNIVDDAELVHAELVHVHVHAHVHVHVANVPLTLSRSRLTHRITRR